MNRLSARIEPFAALTFNLAQTGPLAGLVAPPYDLVDDELREQLYARSPFNIIRLELNRDPDPYSSAAATLTRWIAEGTLRRTTPAIFLYTQQFALDGRRLLRKGLVVRIRLDEFASRRILPHERTFPKAKEDRLRLLAATHANISSIFGLYPSGNLRLETILAGTAQRAPMLEVTDDRGVLNRVYAIDSPADTAAIQQELDSVQVLIADGHHRYETALEYRRQMCSRESRAPQAYDYVMMTLVAFDDPGLVILPTHRIIRRLSAAQTGAYQACIGRNFVVDEFDNSGTMLARLRSSGRGYIGTAVTGSRPSIVRLNHPDYMAEALPQACAEVRELDVSVLHALILEQILAISPEMVRGGEDISYTVDAEAAVDSVASGEAAAAFILNPPTVYEVERVSNAGAAMPEKSTFFYPKLLTGLLVNPLS
jgi:uncharacterized protein (DUF1015 family)